MTKNNILPTQNTGLLYEKIKNYFTFDRILILLIVFGIILRIATYWTGVIQKDGTFYAVIGNGLVQYHNFVLLWDSQPLYQHALTYPAYLAIFYSTFGLGISTTKIAAIVMSILILPVLYLTTRDLLGHQKALIVTAAIALSAELITTTAAGYTENMLILFIVPMMWSMIKSFGDDKYIPLVGLFGGLTYITKQDPGLPIIVAGMLAFILWRLYYMKLTFFKNRNYLLAGIIFLGFVFIRVTLMQTASVIPPVSASEGSALFSTRGLFEFIIQTPLHMIFPAMFAIFWIPELKLAFGKIKQEYYNWLVLIVMGVMLLILFHAAGRQTGLATLSAASTRYFTLAYVPLMWLLLKDADINNIKKPDMGSFFEYTNILKSNKKLCAVLFAILFTCAIAILIDLWWGLILFVGIFATASTISAKKRAGLMLIAFLIVSSSTLIINEHWEYPKEFIDAVEDVSTYAYDGDTLAVDRYNHAQLSIVSTSAYITGPEVTIIEFYEGCNATYLLSQTLDDATYQNFTLLKIYEDNSQLDIREKIYTILKRRLINENFNYSTRPPMKLWKKR